MEYRDLLYDVSDGIATVTLSRPERMNAISAGMLASFSDAFRAADADRLRGLLVEWEKEVAPKR